MDYDIGKKDRRQGEILRLLEQYGYRSVEELCARFSVTSQTIRRDIAELAARQTVKRYHGGVALAGPIDPQTYQRRREQHVDVKRRLAKRVAELVPDGMSIFLDAGSTCEAVAQALVGRSELKVVTYSLRAALMLAERTDFTLAVPGGFVRHMDGSLRGDQVTDFLGRFRFDLAIIAVTGISETGELGDDDHNEVAIVRAAMARSRSVLLISDSSKFHHSALVQLGTFDDVDDLVTDAPPGDRITPLLERAGVRLHIA